MVQFLIKSLDSLKPLTLLSSLWALIFFISQMEAGSWGAGEAGSRRHNRMTECLNRNSTGKANGAKGGLTAIVYASHHAGQSPSHIKTGPLTLESLQWSHLGGTRKWVGYNDAADCIIIRALAKVRMLLN